MAFSLALPDLSISSAEVECPDFVTFILRPNAALDYQTFHAEPQSLLSRGDDTCDRLRSLRGLRPYEERAERPSVYVERMWSVRGAYEEIYCENGVGSSP